jgi:hypothetical protein
MRDYAEKYLSATQEFLAVVKNLKEKQLDVSTADDWTPRQVIHHLADSEAQSYARLRRLIAEPGTIIQGYDESKWADSETLGYQTQPIESALLVFSAVRQASYELITRLSPDQLENAGEHTESGTYTVLKWLETYSNHPREHADQIRTTLKN